MTTEIYIVPAEKGLDNLIERVADKAQISEEAAARAVDVVLTAVKGKLPPQMAEKLVAVVAGEDDFGSPFDKMTRRVARATDTARGSSVRFYRRTEGRMREVVGSLRDFFKHDQGR
jgi:hypothetical protein